MLHSIILYILVAKSGEFLQETEFDENFEEALLSNKSNNNTNKTVTCTSPTKKKKISNDKEPNRKVTVISDTNKPIFGVTFFDTGEQ